MAEPITIVCVEGPGAGKRLLLGRDKPVQMEVRQRGNVAGRLSFALNGAGITFTNASPVESEVNGTPERHAVLVDGDRVRVGRLVFRASCPPGSVEAGDDDATRTNPTIPSRPAADDARGSGRSRTSRRISASRMASVELPEPQREGLLRKVGKAFRRREEGDAQLDELVRQRSEVLQLAGRLALENQGGFGLPGDCLQRLAAGERLQIAFDDLAPAERESFRRHGELLRYLDAEIQARRGELGLGPDPTVEAARRLPLQGMHDEREERAFQVMDDMTTDEVAVDTADLAGIAIEAEAEAEADAGAAPELPSAAGRPAAPSARRRASRRRRR